MGPLQKVLLAILLAGILGLIVLTWGSVGSAILTLALLLAGGMLLLKWFLDTHNADDFRMED